MNIFEKLISKANSVEELSLFIKDNSDEIFNFFINQSHHNLRIYREETDAFLLLSIQTIAKLDLSVNEHQIFIDVLIDTCERLNLASYFKRLCRIKKQSNLPISKRNEAAILYMNGLRTTNDFLNILKDLLDKLQNAFEFEEDTDKRVLSIFFNFYANIIRDFTPNNLEWVESIILKIEKEKMNYSFLNNAIVDSIFLIKDISNSEKVYLKIHSTIDTYLNREIVHLIYNDKKHLIELETEYSNKLKNIAPNISEIRKLSCELDDNLNETFYSLGRGVSILDKEQQLFKYLKSYGSMHFAKCNYAYNFIPSYIFDNIIDIVDWGCGQALASMTYLDFLKKQTIKQQINKITLIEPSEIALKRGSLHIKKMDNTLDISTINKDLNSLCNTDFDTSKKIKLHLFSNILDIDDYSTDQLSQLIKSQFKGLNYMIIISPKITDLKTNRIDNFIKKFDKEELNVIHSETKDSGEWERNWTIVLRIIKLNI